MDIYIDYVLFDQIFSGGPFIAMAKLFLAGGWVPFLIFSLYLSWRLWVLNRQNKFKSKWSVVVLAVDIPRENEQTLKAVENIFVALAGTRTSGDFIDKYWNGKVQESFSWEIASIEGYIQFYVHTPSHFRDVIEATIYAQYPDAAIHEVPDYTENSPEKFPSEEYDMWGSDLLLINASSYPIKTYIVFEDQLSGELKDPMSNMLENMSRLDKGEQFWFQVILTPTSNEWKDVSVKTYKKLIGAKVKAPKKWIDHILNAPISFLEYVGDQVFSREASVSHEEKAAPPSLMQHLSPGEKTVVEAIERKMSKTGLLVKMRIVYLARKEVYNGTKAVAGFFGAMQQFNSLDTNGIRPHAKYRTLKYRLFAKRRKARIQNKILRSYKKRDVLGGGEPYILNVEELATLYHFPVRTVKAQGVRKIDAKRAEAPLALPAEERREGVSEIPLPNLPAVEESADPTDIMRGEESSFEKKKEMSPRKERLPISPDDEGGPPGNLPL